MASYFKYLDDLAKKEKDAQKWAYEKFPKYFRPNSTPQERAIFAQFPEKNYYHGTANIIDDKINSGINPMVDVGKERNIKGFDDSFLGTTTKSDNQAHWFTDDPKTADTYADYNAYIKSYTNLQQEFEGLRSKGLEKLNLEKGDRWDDWINKLDPEDWLSVMTLQNKIKKLVDRGGGMGQQILPVRIRNNNQIVNDTEGASWLGYFSEKDRTKGVKKGTELLSQAKAEGKDSVLFKNLNDTASKWYQKPSNQVAVLNPAVIRSPLATFDLRKLGLGGAGSYLSTDLMADELDLEYKPKPSMFKGLMETIGNANQQQAQAYGDTGVNVASGVGSLLADPSMAAELAVRGVAGLGLGGLLMSNDVVSAEDPRFLERLR